MTLAPFDLNLRHLRALSAIIARGSMSAAADAVSLSQPALTQGLAKLERQLGVALFDRRSNGVAPTPDGTVLAERALSAFAHLAAASRAVGRGGARGFARPEQLMTSTQLRAFLSLADAGSFVGAAAVTALSQPALHRAVRDLEQIVAVALVERRGRGVALTRAGQRLARGVRLAEREIRLALVALRENDVEGGDRIVVGAMPLSRAHILPRAIAGLVAQLPHITVDVVDGSWRELVEPLRDGVIDLMIGALRSDPAPDLVQTPLFTARLVVVGRAGHPLAGVAAPTPAQFAGYPWIIGRSGTPLRDQWQRMFAGRPLPPAPIECGSVTTIRGILLESDGLTLLSPDQVSVETAMGLLVTIGPPRAESTRAIGMTARADWRPGATGTRFVELLRRAALDIALPENG